MSMKIYIEAGANNGIEQTRSMQQAIDEEYFGILIEPLLHSYQSCVENRSNERTKVYHCALVPFSHNKDSIELNLHAHDLMATVVAMPNPEEYPRKYKAPARTLDSILIENDITHVEHLFLDVEGYEFEVLKGVDFNSTSFSNIEIECHYYLKNIPKEEEVDSFVRLLSAQGYTLKGILDEPQPKMQFVSNQ